MEEIKNPIDDSPLEGLLDLIDILRGEEGCPWDRKQTPESVCVYLLEESYELVNAILAGDIKSIFEELGDVLFQVLFITKLFEENGTFDLESVARANTKKMRRRHPHVFGKVNLKSEEEVKQQWYRLKQKEKEEQLQASILDTIPDNLPSLIRANRIFERVERAGVNLEPTIEAIQSSLDKYAKITSKNIREDSEIANIELGNILLLLINIARYSNIHPETALLKAIQRFEIRFKRLENDAREKDLELNDISEVHKRSLWDAGM